jgi:hypothetical protein
MESSDLIRTKFQYVAKLRLNVLFAGIAEGAHRACVLLVIIATSRPLRPLPGYLGLRAPEHSPRSVRASRRAAHAGGVQSHARAPSSAATVHESLRISHPGTSLATGFRTSSSRSKGPGPSPSVE